MQLEILRRELETCADEAALAAMKRAWVDITDPLARWVELVKVLSEACRRFPGVRAHFASLRDAQTPALGATRGIADWLALNEALDDEERTLAWFQETRAQRRRTGRFSRLERVVRIRGTPSDYLWLLADSPESAIRDAVVMYLQHLSMHRGMPPDLEEPRESTLARFELDARRSRNELEQVLEVECMKEIALIVAAFEATEPGNHGLREFAEGLLDSERLRRSYFRWEDRDVSR
jgi:hypothetical protein